MAAYVQGIWSVSVSRDAPASIRRWLAGDACGGMVFNLAGPVYFDNASYPASVILQPVSKYAHSLTLPANSQLAGIRFHPGVSFGVFKTSYEKPAVMSDVEPLPGTHDLASRLVETDGHQARIAALYRWLARKIDFSGVIPPSLSQALAVMRDAEGVDVSCGSTLLSQRQLERQFNKWLGISPKQYQRVLRVKKTLDALKMNPYAGLGGLACENGFSDQAHMTREFKQIAKITPRQYARRVARR